MEAIQIQPSFGPQSGSTRVTVLGSGFTGIVSDQIDRFFCSFGDKTGAILKTPAKILSDSKLSCSTPAQAKPWHAPVGAGVDEISVVAASMYFQYYGMPVFACS
jgi:hypothetical protein